MFEWVLNTPLKLVEYNLKIYLMLFELKKKQHVLTDFHFVVFTHDNILYQQIIHGVFCSDLWETLNIMKSIFDEWKKSARKTVKVKINKAWLRILFIK